MLCVDCRPAEVFVLKSKLRLVKLLKSEIWNRLFDWQQHMTGSPVTDPGVSRHPPFRLGAFFKRICWLNRVLREHEALGSRNYRNLVRGIWHSSRCRTTAWRQLLLLRPKQLFDSGNMGQNNGGALDLRSRPVPLSDGLDTRPCKILDPRLFTQLNKYKYRLHNKNIKLKLKVHQD